MDYQYETLLDERFQMLCQALLVREYPGVQCYPVGMPDGGRDATAPEPGGRIVFQVKYARNPNGLADPLKWVIAAIDGEVNKVKKLVDRGATSFVFMTNLPGTSHLDVGRMDRVQAHLDEVMPIPSMCWWRDDFDRRLDSNYELRFKFPSLLSGADLVRVLWEATGKGEDQQRRSHALSAYFADQSERDSKVRFKQADLSPSPIFDLFIDVPAWPRKVNEPSSKRGLREYQRAIESVVRDRDGAPETSVFYIGGEQADLDVIGIDRNGSMTRSIDHVGAASLIMSHALGRSASKIVLEGAPGQGKSTLAQYIAQVHRARILRSNDINQVPVQDVTTPLMLPFKMELRDLATWLKGVDPWAPGESTEHGRPRSLESALAAHVERYSGGVRFDVSDLIFVMREAPPLIILDALDEVADLDDRQNVVNEVTAATARIESCNTDVRIVVTSRPTAVAGSPTFDSSRFLYLTLAAIHQRLAIEYTKKWSRARNLEQDDLDMLLRTLEEKLQAPHMAELAKNTMQLSILLSLTHLRGSTLPDKRTELYDAYIEVFLNREAEKDRTVRENRELLVNIHRYLGYYLHARAELDGSTGRLSTEELRNVLTDFLEHETASSPSMQRKVTELLDALLTGVVERVVALVSRVEGTYEFEVQPLREYFAAKYLYETAPYAPATRRQSGTKPDRFDGIASNPYWMNVTRFFAGCFSKGELLDLADRTARLIEESEPKEAAYPRTLALCLMQDWVFTQSTPSMQRILSAVFDKAGIRWSAGREMNPARFGSDSSVSLALSPSAGYEILVDHLWPFVAGKASGESLAATCRVLSCQPESYLIAEFWYDESFQKEPAELVSWCTVGNWLSVFRGIAFARFLEILQRMPEGDRPWGLAAFLQGGGELQDLPYSEKKRAVVAILNGIGEGRFSRFDSGKQSDVIRLLNPYFFINALRSPDYVPHMVIDFLGADLSAGHLTDRPYKAITDCVSGFINDSRLVTFDFWRDLLREINSEFGRTWRECVLANISAATRDPVERGAGADQLFNDERSIVDRVRNARRRGRQAAWWQAQYGASRDSLDRAFWILAVLTWVRSEALPGLVMTIDEAVRSLDDAAYESLLEACESAPAYSQISRTAVDVDPLLFRKLNWRTLALLYRRLGGVEQMNIAKDFLASRSRDQSAGPVFLASVSQRILSGEYGEGWIRPLMTAVRRGIVSPPDYGVLRCSENVRSDVLKNCWDLPAVLVSGAHATSNARRRYRPVMDIADSDGWFLA
ncbi:hypothetical protein ABTZ78_21790 [Streptomyces bauhiniae]|uniref:NACHT domain-containing protein n=1 Tax=Streptomyces bauhiniae TaxID=2340725 RepID=UPI00331B7713